MLAEKKQQIHTQISIVNIMKNLITTCPDTVMEYFSKEKQMSLVQAERLEKAGMFSISGTLSTNLKEQNQFYHSVGDKLLKNLDEDHCMKCDKLRKLLETVEFHSKS